MTRNTRNSSSGSNSRGYRQRGRLQVLYGFLLAVSERPTRRTEIIYKNRMAWPAFLQYQNIAERARLIIVSKDPRDKRVYIAITHRGRDYIDAFEGACRVLGVSPIDNKAGL